MSLDLRPPRKSEEFVKYWNRFIVDIAERPNLKSSHLWQLQILCDLCVEYEFLKDVIDMGGRTISNGGGRNGDVIRPAPEIQMIQRTIAEIRTYSKMLDLVLMPDTKTNEEEEKNEFE